MENTQNKSPFVTYLYSLAKTGNRGALADLRQGLSGTPGTTPSMYPYVAPWVPENARGTWQEKVYYITAALFAYYQSGSAGGTNLLADCGNLGSHCRSLIQKEKQSESFEVRFADLLKTNREDLLIYLKQIFGLLKGGEIAINWHQLFFDLQHWNSESQYIQHQWANAFWAYQALNNLSTAIDKH
ncbi:MAG: type I-E CRISPR-associated protein Cse2/CasB [Anaerolineaceae bacterium]